MNAHTRNYVVCLRGEQISRSFSSYRNANQWANSYWDINDQDDGLMDELSIESL